MVVILESTEERHAHQLFRVTESVQRTRLPGATASPLQAEPRLHESRRVHSTEGQIWELLYDLRTDVLHVELALQEVRQAHREVMAWALEPDGKRKMEDIEGKYSLPPGDGSLLRFDRDAMKELMMACRESKDNDGTPETNTASSS
jgi:hypothetical protein